MSNILDNFNRAGPALGSSWYGILDLEIVSNAVQPTALNTYGEAFWPGDIVGNVSEVKYDFYVSNPVNDDYHAYSLDPNGVWVYIDNFPGGLESTGNWTVYLRGLSGDYPFPVTPGEWYTVKAQVGGRIGDPMRAKVWKTSDPEPGTWNVVNTTQPTDLTLVGFPVGYHTLIADNSGIDVSIIDNVSITELVELIERSLLARAWLVRPLTPQDAIQKQVTMNILKRRPLAFSAFVPPVVPDLADEEVDPPGPDCLPPCVGIGAGGGTGWGADGGAEKRAITYCSECDLYFRTETEYLGRGDAGLSSSAHAGYCGSHDRDAHQTKLFVAYTSIPSADFKMRAKLIWDQGVIDYLNVKIYASIPALPAINLDDYLAYDAGWEADYWHSGDNVANFTFLADAETTLGGRPAQYQTDPSDVVINGTSLVTNIFRFQLSNNVTTFNAKFRAANTTTAE